MAVKFEEFYNNFASSLPCRVISKQRLTEYLQSLRISKQIFLFHVVFIFTGFFINK